MGINLLFISAINKMVFFFFFFIFFVSAHKKNNKKQIEKIRVNLILLPLLKIGFCLYHIWLHIHLVNFSGDVEKNPGLKHCVKSVRIRSFSGPYSVRMWENTDQKLRIRTLLTQCSLTLRNI